MRVGIIGSRTYENKRKIREMIWKLKNEFDLTCAHLKVEGKFKGCIYNYLNNKACPLI